MDLVVHLDGDQVLFLGVSSTVDVGQPVAAAASPVNEVTQLTIGEYLKSEVCIVVVLVCLSLRRTLMDPNQNTIATKKTNHTKVQPNEK